jgi:Tfp pilus assembly PilM family ATPase
MEHHSFEIPNGSLVEQRQMIGEELAADLGVEQQDLVYDFWAVPASTSVSAETVRFEVASLRRQIAIRMAKEVNRAKLDCQILSVMPVAIAHAVEMAAPESSDEILCGINLGMTGTSIVFARQGVPVFTRVLRTQHLHSIMQPLQQALQLSPDEARQLLMHIGISTSHACEHASSSVIMQRIEPAVDSLIAEIGRTFDFFHRQPERPFPSKIFVMGGGGVIKNLSQLLENRLQVPAAPWSLPHSPYDASDPLFAIAASLSTMAWEK